MTIKTKAPETLGDLTAIAGWEKLQTSEQATITTETMQIASCLHNVSQAKIAVGEHLSKVREILEPKRLFTVYLKTMFHLSKATAYRYVELYDTAKSSLPELILQAAMMRPDDRLTVKAIKDAPKPPRTTNVVKINEYLDSIQARKPITVVRQESSPESVKKAMFHSAHLLLARIAGKQKQAVLSDVVGMLLTDIGIASEQRFSPQGIPDSFRATRGRPRKAA